MLTSYAWARPTIDGAPAVRLRSPQAACLSSSNGRFPRVVRLLPCLALGLLASADAQPTVRRATNISAILAFPNFYHMRPVLLVGTVAQQPNGDFRVLDDTGSLRVIPDGNAPNGIDEVRGQYWDLGRMKADDPRLAGYDLRATFHIDPDGAWPRPGEVTAIIASSIVPATLPTGLASVAGSTKSPGFAPVSIRSIVLDASRYVDQKVTITGQFYGRNLSGDLPDAPRQSRYDFVRARRRRVDLGDERPSPGEGRKGKKLRARARCAYRHRKVAADFWHG